MKLLSFFPQLLVLVVAVLVLSFSNGSCRKTLVEDVSSSQDSASATVLSSDHSKVAATEVFHFHLDYVEAGPNFNGKSSLPYPAPPPSASPSSPPPPPPAPAPAD